MIPACVAASSAVVTVAAVPRPSSGSAGSAARSTIWVVAPRAASCARAYSTSMRDLDVLDGLPEIPTAGRRLAASPPLHIVVHLDVAPTGPPSSAALAQRPGARGGESRPPRRRPVLR